MSDLKLRIIGTLNSNATVTEVNRVIAKIEKDFSKIKLNVQLDDKVSKSLSDYAKAMENYQKITSDLNRVLKEEKTITKDVNGVTKEKITQQLKSGEVIQKEITRINEKNKATQKEIDNINKLQVAYDKLGQKQKQVTTQTNNGTSTSNQFKNGFTNTTVNSNVNGDITSVKTVQNLEQERKATETLNASKLKLKTTLQQLKQDGKLSAETLAKLNSAIDNSRNIQQVNKLGENISNLNRIRERQNQLLIAQREAEIKANNLKNTKNLTSSQTAQLNAYLQTMNSLTARTPQLNQRLRELSLQFREVSGSAENARRSFGQMMNEAMTRMPVWISASAIFYGIPRLVNAAIDTIVDLDSKLVSLKKVMDEDTNFDRLMETANESAKEFAKTLSESLDVFTEFAKQGYSEKEIPLLSNAALVTSNVGEMEAAQSAGYLTSALVQMKLEATDAMSVIDKWNNVSNKNATTVEKLAQGYSKAASVAKTWGLDMDELNAILGTVTSATKQSGTEVGNFIKNVLPRLTSAPAQKALSMVGVSMTDSNGNLKDALQIYKEVSKEFVKLDQVNQNIVSEGLAGKFHISRMNALLQNMEMVDKIMSDSQNSTNSALIENEKYMQSLEARIAKTKQEFQNLALIIGQAFLTESFVQFLDGMSSLASVAGVASKTFGGLPLLFGTVASAILLMNRNFRASVVEMNLLRASTNGLSMSFAGLSKSLKMIGASFGVGLIFTGIGFAIEKLLGSVGKARQEMEDFESKNKQLLMSFKENQGTISSLADEYAKLDNQVKNGKTLDSEELQRYKDVANELAELMPTLVVGEDEYGNKVLGSAEYIKTKTELLEKQLEVQEKIDLQERKQQAQDDYKTASDSLKEYTKEQDKVLDSLNEKLIEIKKRQVDFSPFFSGKDVKLSSFDEVISKIDELEKKGNRTSNEDKQLEALRSYFNEYDMISLKIEDSKMKIQTASTEVVNSLLDSDNSLSTSAKSLAKDFSIFLTTADDSSKKIDSVMGNLSDNLNYNSNLKNVLNDYGSAIDEYRDKLAQGLSVEALEPSKEKAVSAFNEVKNALLSLVKDGKLSDDSYNKLANQLDITSNSALGLDESLDSLTKTTGMTRSELEAQLAIVPEMADNMTEYGESVESTTQVLSQLKEAINSALDGAAESYKEVSDEISPLNELLEKMANGTNITANEAVNLIAKNKDLASSISFENGQIKINREAVLKLRDAKVASYKQMIDAQKREVQAQSEGLKTKLKNFGVEVKGILTVAQANEALAKAEEERARKMDGLNTDQTGAMYGSTVVQNQYEGITSGINDIKSAYEALDQMSAIASAGLNEVGTSAESSSDKTSKANEKSTYTTDKYKQKMEELGLALAKVDKIKSEYPQRSKKYQDAIKQEIKLKEQQLKLMNAEVNSLNKQIKSGNIVAKGTKTTISTTSPSTSNYASGGSTEASVWNFFKSKGFSDSATAGIMGNLRQESGFRTNAVNPSSGATGIAQWLGGRLSGLKNFAGSQGTSYTNLNTQLEWLWKELNGADPTTKSIINKNGGMNAFMNMGVNDAALLFEKAFERSGGDALANRQKYANSIYAKYAGTTPTGSASADTSSDVADKAQAVDQAKSNVLSMQEEALQIQQQINELQMELVNSVLAGIDYKKAVLEDDLAQIDLVQSYETESSNKWTDAQLKKEKLLRKQFGYEQEAIKYLKEQIKNNKALTEAQKAQLSDDLLQRTQDMISLETQLLDQRKQMADTIVDTYKQAAESIKDTRLKTIDKMIDAINKKDDDESYSKDLAKKQSERQKLLDDIAKYSLDDSFAGIAKVKELQDQLADMDEALDSMQSDREKQLRIDNLNTQKDSIQEEFDNLVNDERKFAKMRSDIINGNSSQIQKDLNKYFSNIKANSNIMGKAISNNLIDLINQANRYLNGKDYKPIKIQKFNTGGYTGDSEGLAYLDKKEIILKENDTENFLSTIEESKTLANSLKSLELGKVLGNTALNFQTSFKRPNAPSLSPSVSTGGENHYHVSFGDLKVTGDQNGAKTLLNTFVNGVRKLGGNI